MYCYTNNDGVLSIISFSRGVDINMEAKKLGIKELVKIDKVPQSRNWRNAWQLQDGKVLVDLGMAKKAQKQLAVAKAIERVGKDLHGQPKQDSLNALGVEINAIDWDAPQTLDELYNTWPASIDARKEKREYPL